MNKLRKNGIFLFLILFLGLFISVNEVNAISVTKGSYINFKDYGLKVEGTSHYRTSIKKSGSNDVFCIQYKKNFTAGTYTAGNCSSNGITKGITDTHLVVAGQIISIIDGKDWSSNKKYAFKVATLNTYFKSLNVTLSAGSAKFNGSDEISKIISTAKSNATYYGANKSKNISKPSIAVNGSNIMKTYGNTTTFISNQITFSNLNAKFNGTTPVYKFTTSGTGTFYLCTSKTSGCKLASEVTVSGTDSAKYYLKVVGAKADSNISVKITGTSSTKYSKGGIYCKGTSNQAMLMASSKEQSYSNYQTITLQVPDTTKHQISILKVDESGESIEGSEFQLYEKDSNKQLSLTNNGALFTYVSPTIATTEDNFFNKTYCYKETKTPDGYRTVSDPVCIDVKNESSSICYNNETSEEETDSNYCNTNIVYMCKTEKTTVNVTNNEDGTTTESTPVSSTEYSELSEAGCVAPESAETTTETGVEKVSYTAEKKCVLKKSDDSYEEKDDKYCESIDKYTLIEVSSGNIFITVPNQKNSVIISKKAITGDDEVAGARLKICTEADYNEKNTECSATKTINDVELSWVSSDSPAEFEGIKAGTYYIIEETPPAGYKLSATIATEFSIDENGTIKTGDTEVVDNKVVINNELNELSISKTDITTGKELAGAKLSICATVTSNIDTNDNEDDEDDVASSENTSEKKYTLELDESGNCLPVSLADGSEASWTSTDQPYTIKGLPAGTYYLVETSAPNGYSTTESILFTMKKDGTLADKDGNAIADNKIVMKDEPIKQVPTGMLSIYIVLGILVIVVIVGSCTYYYSAKGIRRSSVKNDKIRKRKIHKM